MSRALYTAATGMIAQQMNVDNIANNLAEFETVYCVEKEPNNPIAKSKSKVGKKQRRFNKKSRFKKNKRK